MKKTVTSKKLTKKEIAEREAVINGPLYTDADVKRYIGVVLEQSNENVKAVAEQYMSLNGKIEWLTDGFTELNGKVEVLSDCFTELNGKVEVLSDGFTELNGKVEMLSDGFTELNGKVDALNQQVTHLDMKVDGIDIRLGNIERDVSIIKSDLKKKVDYDEFEALTLRVLKLEEKLRS